MPVQDDPNERMQSPMLAPARARSRILVDFTLSWFLYTLFWSSAALVGAALGPLAIVAAALLLWIRSRTRSTPQRALCVDGAASLATGYVFPAWLGVAGPDPLLWMPPLAGLVLASIRHRQMALYLEKKLLRHVALASMGAAGVLMGYGAFLITQAKSNVPAEIVTPAVLADGWSLTPGASRLAEVFNTRIQLQKGSSFALISASLFPEDPLTEKEFQEEVEALFILAEGPTLDLTGKETVAVGARSRYVLRYRVSGEDPASGARFLVYSYLYCERVQTSIRSFAHLRDAPIEPLLGELEAMVSSLECPGV